MNQGWSLLRDTQKSVTDVSAGQPASTMFCASRFSKKIVGKILDMMLPDAGLNKLSLSGSNQANSRATNLDLLNQMASPFELCFSCHVRTKRVLNTFELAGITSGLCRTCKRSKL
jgi:hypothetical protein